MLKIGHRGAPHLAPPNTMASFHRAVEMGCHWVECDCRVSGDGVIVLSHDASVRDSAGNLHTVEDCSASELSALDLGAGEGVPTLASLVSWADGVCGVMADIKCEGVEREIGEILASLSTYDCIVPGAGPESRRRFRGFQPSLPLSISYGPRDEATLLAQLPAIDTEGVTLHHSLVTPQRIAELHLRDIRVFAWTVDDMDTLLRLTGWGVDGLISNRSDLLADL